MSYETRDEVITSRAKLAEQLAQAEKRIRELEAGPRTSQERFTLREEYPSKFEALLDKYLNDGYKVCEGTMMGVYQQDRAYGCFMCVVEKPKKEQ